MTRNGFRLSSALAVATALALVGCSGGSGTGTTSGASQAGSSTAGISAAAGSSGSASSAAAGSGALLTVPREDTSTFTRNFNPFSPNALPMTNQSIFESMLIYNSAKGNTVPWLATKWDWTNNDKTLTYTLRPGVKWSDGQPFTSKDVVYAFTESQKLTSSYPYISSIKAAGDLSVVFTFGTVFTPGLYELGQQVIVPEHIWSKQADPAKWTNPEPVGTGPYTQVANFSSQSFDLTKNPNYWQPDKQQIPGIRMEAFAGNDAANLATVNGQTDWSFQFIPSVQKTYVDKDPARRHFWYPTTGGTINLQLNTTKAPYSDVNFRKALSMAINRDQVATIGEYGYTHAADCTGLSDSLQSWKDASVVNGCSWTKLDVSAANALLDQSGYPKGANGIRTMKDGKPLTIPISVGSTSTDWVSVAQVIVKNLQAVGLNATLNAKDWSSVSDSYNKGTFDAGIVWSGNGPTPYNFYKGEMGCASVKPVGTDANENYHRFCDKQADTWLTQLAGTSDPAQQKSVSNQLQQLFDKDAPVVPLFPSPVWGAYTDVHFTGWPSKDNPYAPLSERDTTTVLILTSLKPAS